MSFLTSNTDNRLRVFVTGEVDALPPSGPSLRDTWPNLSDEQRDALVGRALGIEAPTEWGVRIKENGILSLSGKTRDEVIDFMSRHPSLATTHEVASYQFWPLYSETWDGFGSIWGECQRRGWSVSLVDRGLRRPTTAQAVVNGKGSDECATGPEALALAFCLACDVQVPAEWIEAAADLSGARGLFGELMIGGPHDDSATTKEG